MPKKPHSVLPDHETVLFGVRGGDEGWEEELLCTQPERFDAVKRIAARDGWGRFRVAVIDLRNPPDFKRTITRDGP